MAKENLRILKVKTKQLTGLGDAWLIATCLDVKSGKIEDYRLFIEGDHRTDVIVDGYKVLNITNFILNDIIKSLPRSKEEDISEMCRDEQIDSILLKDIFKERGIDITLREAYCMHSIYSDLYCAQWLGWFTNSHDKIFIEEVYCIIDAINDSINFNKFGY